MDEVQLDALPYYDKLTEDPKVKKRVEALIEAECSQFRPKKAYSGFKNWVRRRNFGDFWKFRKNGHQFINAL